MCLCRRQGRPTGLISYVRLSYSKKPLYLSLIHILPRTIAQAEALEQGGIQFEAVVSIEISDEVIMDRMSGRRVCESWGASYHLVAVPPKQADVCDSCGGKLVQRKDDAPETVKARLEVYHKETEPLKDFYAQRGLLKSVENQLSVAETSQAILKALGR